MSIYHCIVGLVNDSHFLSQDVGFNLLPGTYNQKADAIQPSPYFATLLRPALEPQLPIYTGG
jgi:hypothetical protein